MKRSPASRTSTRCAAPIAGGARCRRPINHRLLSPYGEGPQLRTALEQARSVKAGAAPLTQEQKLAQWEQLKVESMLPHE